MKEGVKEEDDSRSNIGHLENSCPSSKKHFQNYWKLTK